MFVESNRIKMCVTQGSEVAQLAQKLNISELTAGLILHRDVKPAQIDSWLADDPRNFHDPLLLPDMQKAVSIISDCLDRNDLICVCGDYDADGVCSTTLLIQALQELGAEDAFCLLPNRLDGYGFSKNEVQEAFESGVELIITVDCGSSDAASVSMARELGMKVVVTDHHSLAPEAPPADAFVNPHRRDLDDCLYPCENICGTCVAWKLVCALFRQRGLSAEACYKWLDLVAIATITDVMPLVGENRLICRTGFRELAKNSRPGLAALAQTGNCRLDEMSSTPLGFTIGPRLNVAGRVDDPRKAYDLLMAANMEEALPLAREIEHLLTVRKQLQEHIRSEVDGRLRGRTLKDLGNFIFEMGEDWHYGVVGLTASSLEHAWNAPVFLGYRISAGSREPADEPDYGKSGVAESDVFVGSARCPENINLMSIFQATEPVWERFGGHAGAGGFSFKADRLEEVRLAVAKAVQEIGAPLLPLWVDYALPLSALTLGIVKEFKMLEPLGQSNKAPLFLLPKASLSEMRVIGKDKGSLTFTVSDRSPVSLKGLMFGVAKDIELLSIADLNYDLLVETDVNSFRGQEELNILVEEIVRPHGNVLRFAGENVLSWEELELKWQSPLRELDGRLTDARGVKDKKRYIRRLLEDGPTLILLNNPPAGESDPAKHRGQQVHFWHSWLGEEYASRAHFATWQELADLSASFEHIVLAVIPESLQAFAQAAQAGLDAHYIHFMLEAAKMRSTYASLDSQVLSPQQIKTVWQEGQAYLRQGLSAKRCQGFMEWVGKNKGIPVGMVREALAALREAELIVWRPTQEGPSAFLNEHNQAPRMENSPRYRAARSFHENLLQAYRALSQPILASTLFAE